MPHNWEIATSGIRQKVKLPIWKIAKLAPNHFGNEQRKVRYKQELTNEVFEKSHVYDSPVLRSNSKRLLPHQSDADEALIKSKQRF